MSAVAPATVRIRSRLFAGVVTGWALANVADSLLLVILGVWVAELTGSAALGALSFALFGVPALFAPLLGRLADRVSRRRMLVASYLVAAAGLLPLFLVQDPSQFWIIYASLIVYATVSYATAGCRGGILRDLLADDDLGQANAILQSIDQVLRLALPFLAAGIYLWTGPLPIIATAIVAFALAALVFGLLRFAESPVDEDPDPFWRSVTAGFRHLFGAAPLGRLTVSLTLLSSTAAFTSSVGFAVLERMGIDAAWMGPLEAMIGLGGLLAGLTAAALMTRFGRVRVMAGGALLMAVGVAPMLSDSVWLMGAGLAVIGLGVTAAVISYVTESQIRTPARMQGRVGTTVNMLLQLPAVFITASGAALLGIVDARVIITCGIAMSIASFAIAATTRASRG